MREGFRLSTIAGPMPRTAIRSSTTRNAGLPGCWRARISRNSMIASARFSPRFGMAVSVCKSAVLGSIRSARSPKRAGRSGCGSLTNVGVQANRIPRPRHSTVRIAKSARRCGAVQARAGSSEGGGAAGLPGWGGSGFIATKCGKPRGRSRSRLADLVLPDALAHLLQADERRLGLQDVVQQSAAGQERVEVGQVGPGDAFDEGLAEREVVDGLHPLGLELGVPGAVPPSRRRRD